MLIPQKDLETIIRDAKQDCIPGRSPSLNLKQRIVIHCCDRVKQKQGALMLMVGDEENTRYLMNLMTFYVAVMMRMELPLEYLGGE